MIPPTARRSASKEDYRGEQQEERILNEDKKKENDKGMEGRMERERERERERENTTYGN
jgi:hypothetical protein